MTAQNNDLAFFSQKVEKHITALLNAAYAMIGRREDAIAASREALLLAYYARQEWMHVLPTGDGLLHYLVKIAQRMHRRQRRKGATQPDWETTLPGMNRDAVRIMVMHYGCLLSPGYIASVTGMRRKTVRAVLAKLKKSTRETKLEEMSEDLLNSETLTGDSRNGILYEFQTAVRAQRGLSFSLKRVFTVLLRTLELLLLAALAYLICVLFT